MRARQVLRLSTVALLLLVAPLPGRADTSSAPMAALDGQDLASQVLALGLLDGDDFAAHAHTLLAQRPDGPGLGRYAVVPESIFRGAEATCDLDGDGVNDLVSNDMQLRRNGNFDSGFSTLRALSGANGDELWQQDNQLYYNLALGNAYSAFRPGQPSPIEPPNMIPTVDVDGDGTCDVLAYGFAGTGIFSTPLFGNPSVAQVDVTVRALSGKDGSALWTRVVTATDVDGTDPLYPIESTRVIRNFPTGFLATLTPDGPRLVLKTTDLYYVYAVDPFEVTAPLVDGDALWVANLATGEHIEALDVQTGQPVWARDYPVNLDADNVNMTWLSGMDDLNGDGHADLVLDQFTLSNPRGAQFTRPDTGEPMYRHGRGMRMFALDGTNGGDLWGTTLLDPLAVQTAPVGEENQEILAWTHGSVLPDVDGDGRADPLAQYLAEEFVGGTPNGRHRTHFILLDGATGQPRWDFKQQGWGFASTQGLQRLAVATLDLPEGNTDGGRPPVKALRIAGLDASTGNPDWSYESSFAQDSQSTYELGLHQVRTSLAPLDLDGDGLRDIVTPSRYVAPEGRSQVFLATARQTFQVLDGKTGAVHTTLESWGSNALLLPCTVGSDLTFVVGHARRLDLVRIDAGTGETLMRHAIWNFNEPRASLAGIDLLGLAGSCNLVDDRLTFAVNMEAFSFFRRYEIVPLIGVLGTDGQAKWLNPELPGGNPPTPTLLETLAYPEPAVQPGLPLLLLTIVLAVAGLAAGALLGIPTGRWLARRRRRFDPLGLAMVLLVLPGASLGGLAGGEATTEATAPVADPGAGPTGVEDLAPAVGEPAPTTAQAWAAAAPFELTAAEEVARWSWAQAGVGWTPDVSQHFNENDTMTFTHPLADLDGDGVQDLALDVYCMACYTPYPGLTQPVEYIQRSLQGEICGPEHTLVVISGARGDRLWDERLDRVTAARVAGATTSCSAEAVVGVVPLPDGGSGILLYRFESLDVELGMTGRLYNHTLFLRHGATGSILWSYAQSGYMTPTYLNSYEILGVNVMLNPMLVEPEAGRVVDRLAGAGWGLFVQGIGYRLSNLNTVGGVPGIDHGPRVEDGYDPNQWMARLDPVTGTVHWTANTFQPDGQRSILPFPSKESLLRDQYYAAEEHNAYDYPYPLPAAIPVNTWGDILCCGDLTGDGVFDPTFTTLEWSKSPNTNVGPHRFDTTLVAFDGASGTRLYTVPLFTDVEGESAPNRKPFWRYPYDNVAITMKAIGDADGDGRGDLMLLSELVYTDYVMDVRVIDGDSGQSLWVKQFPRAQGVLNLGDADGDGGNDLLFVDWFRRERTRVISGDMTNVTTTPLRLRSGATGEVLYQTSTVNAPMDVQHTFATLARRGVPDFDLDGVGDFPVDDPIYLPDQITLHQLEFLSGRDAHRLFSVPVAGAMAFPAPMPDLDGDGRPELAVLSGDPTDIWMSYRDGKDGSALWGHRATSLKASSFALIRPNVDIQGLQTGFGEHDVGFLLNLHLDVEAVTGEYEAIYIDGSGTTPVRELYIDEVTLPQLTVVLDADGQASWSYPSQGDLALSRTDGESAGTAQVLAIREVAEPSAGQAIAWFLQDVQVPLLAFLLAFVAALATVSVILRRRTVTP